MTSLRLLQEIVAHETPSTDKEACDALAAFLRQRWMAAGAEVEVHANASGGDHIEARFGPSAGAPALILCHLDTVWPIGTLDRLPFRVADGKAYGPGIYDMKASLCMVDVLMGTAQPSRPVRVLVTSDEEIGSPSSRALIEACADEAAYVLVLEPPLAPGTIKMRRKGTGRFTLEVEGRSAHAGLNPEQGVSATVELAHQVVRVAALNDPASGTTLNVGVVRGGTTTNVVAATASADLDVRVWTLEEAARITEALHGLTPVLPGAALRVRGGLHRPPMELTAAQAAFFTRAASIAASAGVTLTHGAVGGGSDGNFTAARGIPTLDGLGCPGDGAHAEHEHILVGHLDAQVGLLAALLAHL